MSKDNVGFIHIAEKSKIMERRLYHLLHQPALAHSCHFQSPILPQPHILQVQILPTRLPFQVQIMRLQPMRVAPYTRHQLHNIPPPLIKARPIKKTDSHSKAPRTRRLRKWPHLTWAQHSMVYNHDLGQAQNYAKTLIQ